MRFFRQIIADMTSGGLLAAVIAVMLLLQGAIGGYAQAATAADDPGVICSLHGTETGSHKQTDGSERRDCCLTACRIAAAFTATLPAKSPAIVSRLPVVSDVLGIPPGDFVSPHRLGLARDARGPPPVSL
ncbi:hypothetical protein KX729_08190 [Rhizobium sp. XQZ8]|uniref:DUF2946 family protein n=1 Tax=Rhizobium populisoli TaxID=2859785 RepID=UPI001CA57C19|nr:DUF2946 family protein [Rhizobium populisoli]MBW6421418.1 hypothetical protein [Rhizobium populisoli]